MHRNIENRTKANPYFFTPATSFKKITKRVMTSHQASRPINILLSHTRLDSAEPLGLISKSSFAYQYAIGRGGFGKVWKVEMKRTKELYALKEMQKLRVISKRSVHSVMNERKILETLRSSFIVNMHYAFQDRENLYLVMDLKNGGDLRYHIAKNKRFNEVQAKFIVACIVSGLQYIHSNGIIHRDIKPENLVFDERGYLHTTDFGIARIWVPENSKDTSGTPGYMAPEVLFRQNHGIAADYFAVGVILYEIMMGRRPYIGRDRKEIRDQIVSRQARVTEVPEGWSLEAADFINKLIQRKANYRLGNKGFGEINSHPWLKDFPWKDLFMGSLSAPYIPKSQDNFDPRNLGDWKDEIDPTIDLASSQNLFIGYSYDERVLMEVNNAHHKKSLSSF
ncbi:hypothetical protein SteCoe_29724 [Stentor coeruleus]|uniref:non-specific serine/threonine protein kinase n=1 Tax=Stentor coeruleus TaxID=5963 RepID=A0A1R2B5A2_9CILI|nr:hypothetical protein SteCoe_29724 [Stentor coeruleus]